MVAEQPRVSRVDEQETATFYGHAIVAVRLDVGPIVIAIQSLCAAMNLNAQAQK
jgi:hypothetical protein